MVQPDALVAGEHERGLQGLFQLPQVARPTVHEQRPGCLAGEADLVHRAPELAAQEGADEQPEVLTALAYGRELQGEPGQPREQIAAEPLLCRERLQIVLARRDDPDVHLARRFGPDGQDLAMLQHAEQKRLRRSGQLLHAGEE